MGATKKRKNLEMEQTEDKVQEAVTTWMTPRKGAKRNSVRT